MVLGGGCVRSDLAPGVSPAAIQSIQLGMDLEAVIDALGLPLSVYAVQPVHTSGCRTRSLLLERDVTDEAQLRLWLVSMYNAAPCCEVNRRDRVGKTFSLVYSGVDQLGVSPMLRVHFEHDRVRSVGAALSSFSPFRDEQGVYLLNTFQKRTHDGHHTTVVQRYCKEDLLHKFFSP
jgi:hypothetical protein